MPQPNDLRARPARLRSGERVARPHQTFDEVIDRHVRRRATQDARTALHFAGDVFDDGGGLSPFPVGRESARCQSPRARVPPRRAAKASRPRRRRRPRVAVESRITRPRESRRDVSEHDINEARADADVARDSRLAPTDPRHRRRHRRCDVSFASRSRRNAPSNASGASSSATSIAVSRTRYTTPEQSGSPDASPLDGRIATTPRAG